MKINLSHISDFFSERCFSSWKPGCLCLLPVTGNVSSSLMPLLTALSDFPNYGTRSHWVDGGTRHLLQQVFHFSPSSPPCVRSAARTRSPASGVDIHSTLLNSHSIVSIHHRDVSPRETIAAKACVVTL